MENKQVYTSPETSGFLNVAAEASDTSCSPLFVTAASGVLAPKTNTGLTFDASTGDLESLIKGIFTANGAAFKFKSISEAVTIPVGSGAAPVVTSTANLFPVGVFAFAVAFRVTQAPGGGATTLTVTTDTDAKDLISTAPCAASGNTSNSFDASYGTGFSNTNNWITTAQKARLTTDADVTVSDMIVRVTVFYLEVTAPTS